MTGESNTTPHPLDHLQACPTGVAIVDADGVITYINQSFTDMTGVEKNALNGVHHSVVADANLRALFTGQPSASLHAREGKEHLLSHTEAPYHQGSIHYFTDQTEYFQLKQEKELLDREVAQLQLTDPATGLYTERAIMLILEPQVSLCRRYENPLAIMYIAIDFGANADTDKALDEKILRISHLLKDQVRWADMIGRTGKDRVILVLPETGMEAAQLLAEKITGVLTGLEDIQQVYTGITGWKKSDSATRLLSRASEALQQARAGAESSITTL